MGWVVRKPVKANPGLNIKPSIKFSLYKLFFNGYVLCSLTLFKTQIESKT